MWYVQNILDKNSNKIALLSGSNYSIGRKDCSLLIVGDSSISRKHSSLCVIHSESTLHDPQNLPVLTLIDFSKCGTSVNDTTIAKNAPTQLQDGDYFVCGTQNNTNKWLVKYKPMVVMASCLTKEERQLVRKKLATLGGHLVNEWRKECTMLVMTKIKVTIKVICAIVACNHIVKPSYFDSLIDSIKEKTDPPVPKEFLPPLEEPSLESDKICFESCPDRKTLFSGKTFIFLTQKQFKRLSEAVSLAGGKPVLMEEDSDDGGDSMLVAPGTCVMDAVGTAQLSHNARNWITRVKDVLTKHGLRVINDSELTLAILYRSTSTHCCPQLVQAGVSRLQSHAISALDTQALVSQIQQQLQPSPIRVRKRNDSADTDVLASKYQKLEVGMSGCPIDSAGDRREEEQQPTSIPEPQPDTESILPIEKLTPIISIGPSAARGDNSMAIEPIRESANFVDTVNLKRTRDKPISTDSAEGQQKAKRIKPLLKSQGSSQNFVPFHRQDAATTNPSRKSLPKKLLEPRMGYISTSRPSGEQSGIVTVQKPKEEEEHLKVGGTTINVIPLIVKTPKPKQFSTPKTAATNGSTKNFKKFRKTDYPGYRQLPKIIGGKELEIYEKIPEKKAQAMFDHRTQNDSQEESREALANDLFCYPLSKKRTSRK